MPKDTKKMAKKRAQVKWVYDLLGKYSQIVQVSLDHVTSKQFKTIHSDVRKNGGCLIVLKNSLVKKATEFRIGGAEFVKPEKFAWAQDYVTEAPMPELQSFLPLLKNQCGYIFTNEPVFDLKPRIEGLVVPAAAKIGLDAQCDVSIQPGPTGMDPSQISFFHALQITTKIVKGQIEIQKEYAVCTKGKKVGHSQVALLKSMNMRPFTYGMKVYQMYDAGAILDSATCSISPDDLLGAFKEGVSNITALSLETGYTTELSVPHSIINCFKSLAAIGMETDYKFDFLESAMSAKSSAPAPAASKDTGKTESKKETKKVESEKDDESVDMGGGMGLFGDDDF